MINMPIGGPAPGENNPQFLPIKVHDFRSDGSLAEIQLNNQRWGNNEAAFDLLNRRILGLIGDPGNPLTKDMEVEIDAGIITCITATIKKRLVPPAR